MINLEHLLPPPASGHVTAYENDGRLRALGNSEALSTTRNLLGGQFIEVTVGQEPVRTAHSKQEAREAFSAHTETPWQRVMFAYYEEGWEASLEEMIKGKDEGSLYQIASTVASVILKVCGIITKAQALLSSPKSNGSSPIPPLALCGSGGSVVSVAWHPHTNTLAAVFCDDTVRVFAAGRSITPLLKHRLQKSIMQIAWMPYSASLLAVGCECGVLLWTLDPVNVVTRPSGSCVSLLAYPSATPINSLTWHPKGNLLACVGGNNSQLVVWDVGREVPVVVHSGTGGSISLILWSPNSSRLFVAYSSKIMRVFETRSWTYEQWSLESPVQSAVWSSLGHLLLFVTQDDPVLYYLGFIPGESVGGTQVAAQVADLTQTLVADENGEEISVGGLVRQLTWDTRSERLAIVFRDTECVVLFHTHTHPTLHLAPGGFIRGELGHVPVSVSFQKNLSSGAVLSVVWSSGQVQHIPMRYSSREPLNSTLNTSHFNTSVRVAHNSLLNSTIPLNSSMGYAGSPITSPLIGGLFTSP
ncbi:aladin [Procambarus clarkii]|uniref:aladin n=1 Tax=Procambarus clarkii TaxID=6728 RepID=UPI001E6732F2|nr:aladin-like [Procambarus clarkii]XP_045581684.1 aladin-like [Procambarus clarkii]XP_045581685.1 aladin-like [Procambarus clarkii]